MIPKEDDPAMISLDMEGYLVQRVQESLDLYLFSNATFLAERLVCDFPTEVNIFLLATCYHRSNETYRTYQLLKGLKSSHARYLLALSCLQLGKLAEAEEALAPGKNLELVPNGAAGFHLLGRIARLSNRATAAAKHYSRALRLDPCLWASFEELCAMGFAQEAAEHAENLRRFSAPSSEEAHESGVEVPTVVEAASEREASAASEREATAAAERETSVAAALQKSRTGHGSEASRQPAAAAAPPEPTPFTAAGPRRGGALSFVSYAQRGTPMTLDRSAGQTAGTDATPFAFPTIAPARRETATPTTDFVTPQVESLVREPPPMPAARLPPRGAWLAEGSPGVLTGAAEAGGAALAAAPEEGKKRKMGRLFVDPTTTTSKAGGSSSLSLDPSVFDSPQEDAQILLPASPHPPLSPGLPVGAGAPGTRGRRRALGMLATLARPAALLSAYRCREAVQAFAALAPQHYESGWVLCAVGRALAEDSDHAGAMQAFRRARAADPWRLAGLDVASTVLWQLRAEAELAVLAQAAVSLDRASAVAWCVAGNCMSLQREHATALAYFHRALQLEPSYAYAYTLSGHEYAANDDLDKALTCYRNALRADSQHYNAWFGVGHVYYRQEQYPLAEYHFRRALSINKNSSVLRCYLGMALHKIGRLPDALATLTAATAADPRNPLARFERAAVLVAQERLPDALEELEALKNVAPREASVLFQMGKVLKKMGRTDEALACLCAALDLQPPSADSNLIRAAVERLKVADEQDGEEL